MFRHIFLRNAARLLAIGLLTGQASVFAENGEADTFFNETAPNYGTLPADQVYPHGRQFLFTFFSVGGGTEEQMGALFSEEEIQKEFTRYKALNIPFFGPQYELNEHSLQDAEKYNLKVLYDIGIKMDFHNKRKDGNPPPKLTSEEITQQITDQVRAVVDNPHIAVWYLRPEELRPWRKNEMEYLELASKAIRAADSQNRPIWIYDPAHASANRLSSIAPWVDMIGKGMYTNYVSQKDSRIYCRWSVEQEIEAIKLAGTKAVPIAVPEMFRQPDEADIAKIPAWVRHDSYLALVSGAKGIAVFSLRRRPNFPAREAYYKAYAGLAEELLGEKHLGDVFLFGEKRNAVSVEVTNGPQEIAFLYPSGGVKEPIPYPSVSHAEFAYGKVRYLFVVNSANEPVTLAIGGMPYAAVKAESLLDNDPAIDVAEGEFEVTLNPLEVKVWRLERR